MLAQELPKVSLNNSIKKSFAKFCSFKGRSRRSEFWFFYLFINLIIMIPAIIFIMIFVKDIIKAIKSLKFLYKHHKDDDDDDDDEVYSDLWPLIVIGVLLLISVILLIPLISLSVRRLHDIGKSGCYLFLCLIPFGIIVIFIFLIEDSHQNMNEYGPSPKYVMMPADPLLYNSQIISVVGTPLIYSQSSQGYQIQNTESLDENLSQEPVEENQEDFDISRGSIAKPVFP